MNMHSKKKIKLIAFFTHVLLFLKIFILSSCTGDGKKSHPNYLGQIGDEKDIIMRLTSENEKLVGFYYPYCDSANKTFLVGELESENSFTLIEKSNNLGADAEIKGNIINGEAIIAERTNLKTGKKDQLLFRVVSSKVLAQIKCSQNLEPQILEFPTDAPIDYIPPVTPIPVSVDTSNWKQTPSTANVLDCQLCSGRPNLHVNNSNNSVSWDYCSTAESIKLIVTSSSGKFQKTYSLSSAVNNFIIPLGSESVIKNNPSIPLHDRFSITIEIICNGNKIQSETKTNVKLKCG